MNNAYDYELVVMKLAQEKTPAGRYYVIADALNRGRITTEQAVALMDEPVSTSAKDKE